MNINWKRHGHVFDSRGLSCLHSSHTQLPVAFKLDANTLRVYYSSRCEKGFSRIFYVDIQDEEPFDILSTPVSPVLDIGQLGAFDDSGVMPSSIVSNNNVVYLYYIGWNSRGNFIAPYTNSVGLAISTDNGNSFTRYSQGPLISRNEYEPFFCGTSCVLHDGDVWKNWYQSCDSWEMKNEKAEPRYNLKYIESNNGVSWTKKPQIAIDYKNSEEGGISKATVIKNNKDYLMWFSYRGVFDYRETTQNSYRIGFAFSNDGNNWVRDDNQFNLELSKDSWDSNMMEYPDVIKYKNRYLMFYNGDGFGQTGFGLAIGTKNK